MKHNEAYNIILDNGMINNEVLKGYDIHVLELGNSKIQQMEEITGLDIKGIVMVGREYIMIFLKDSIKYEVYFKNTLQYKIIDLIK